MDKVREAHTAYQEAAQAYFDTPEIPYLEKKTALRAAKKALGVLDAEVTLARMKKEHDDAEVD